MHTLYIGAGFVGTCSAAVTASSGHDVLVYDINKERIKKLSSNKREEIESCLFEDGLAELLLRHRDHIAFTHDISRVQAFIDKVEAIFMCLPTPEKIANNTVAVEVSRIQKMHVQQDNQMLQNNASGESDLSYYESALQTLAGALVKRQASAQTKYILIINKSTLPISMINRTKETLRARGVKNFGVVSNPEFLIEGRAINGSIHPDRVVVGAESARDFAIMRSLYQRFYNSSSVKYIEVNPQEAEAGKLLANFVLFSRLAVCFDVIGRVCEKFPGISFEKVRDILKSSPRIGSWGLYDSLFAGGSCFIKDAASLAYQLESAGGNAELVRAALGANTYQIEHFLRRIKEDARFVVKGKRIAFLGVAFKQNTNDVRNSGAINAARFFLDEGAKEVRVYDPAAQNEFKKIFNSQRRAQFKKITYASSEVDCLKNTSVALIATDWPQFQSLAPLIRKVVKPPYLILDGRRMLNGAYAYLQKAGYSILAVGSPFIKGKITARKSYTATATPRVSHAKSL